MARAPSQWKEKTEIIIIEVGFCSDTYYKQKLLEKTWQHRHMVSRLQAKGWKVTQGEVIIGNGGTIYGTSMSAIECVLGLSKTRGNKLAGKLSLQAIKNTYNCVLARRFLDVG